MTTYFLVVRLPPERDPSDLIHHVVSDKFQFAVASELQEVDFFMKVGQEAEESIALNQLSRTSETATVASPPFHQQIYNDGPSDVKRFEPLPDVVKKEAIQDGDYGIDKFRLQQTQPQLGEPKMKRGENVNSEKPDSVSQPIDQRIRKANEPSPGLVDPLPEDVKKEVTQDGDFNKTQQQQAESQLGEPEKKKKKGDSENSQKPASISPPFDQQIPKTTDFSIARLLELSDDEVKKEVIQGEDYGIDKSRSTQQEEPQTRSAEKQKKGKVNSQVVDYGIQKTCELQTAPGLIEEEEKRGQNVNSQTPASSPSLPPQQAPEHSDPQPINIVQLLTGDVVKKEEIQDGGDYGTDESRQQQDEPEPSELQGVIRGETTAQENEAKRCPLLPHLVFSPLPKSHLQMDFPHPYFPKQGTLEENNDGKFLFPVKTWKMKRRHESPPPTLTPIRQPVKLVTIVPQKQENYLDMPTTSSSFYVPHQKVTVSSDERSIFKRIKDRDPDPIKIGDSVRARGIMKPFAMTSEERRYIPPVRIETPLPPMPHTVASVADFSEGSDERKRPMHHLWSISRLIELLGKGPFFAFNFTTPLQQEYAPRFLANFCNPRGTFPGTPFCPGSLFFYAEIKMEDKPWLCLCPKTIARKFRFRRFVFFKKSSGNELIQALFQYVIEVADKESTEHKRVLKSKMIEVDPLRNKTPLSITLVPEKAGAPVVRAQSLVPPIPPSAPIPPIDRDVVVESIVSGLRVNGFFFAASFLTPLEMSVIPSILKKQGNKDFSEIPMDFFKSYSFFRVSGPAAQPERDGYSPWANKEMIQETVDDVTVTRYSFTHTSSDRFKRFMYTIGSKKDEHELFLYQYIVEGPMEPIAWIERKRRRNTRQECRRNAAETRKSSESLESKEKEKIQLERTSSEEDKDEKKSVAPELRILAAPRRTSTRIVKLPARFQ